MKKCIYVVGFSQPCALFSEVAEALSPDGNYAIISSSELAKNKLEHNISYVEQLSEELSPLRETILVAWSLGGIIGLELAAEYPGKLAAMVLVSSTACFLEQDDYPIGVRKKSLAALVAGISASRKDTLDRFIKSMLNDSVDAALIRLLQSNARSVEKLLLLDNLEYLKQDFRNILQKIETPTLLVHGSEDKVISSDNSVYCNNHLTNSNMILYQGCAHLPFVEEKDRFVSDVTRFLSML